MKRFSLRTMLLVVVAIGVALVAGIVVKERLETKSLASCIAAANDQAPQELYGRAIPRLTEAAVYRSIEMRLNGADNPAWMKWRLRKILRSGRVPKNSSIHGATTMVERRGWFTSTPHTEWTYMLDVVKEDNRVFGIELWPQADSENSTGVDWSEVTYATCSTLYLWLAAILPGKLLMR